jgi:hypothetical protein
MNFKSANNEVIISNDGEAFVDDSYLGCTSNHQTSGTDTHPETSNAHATSAIGNLEGEKPNLGAAPLYCRGSCKPQQKSLVSYELAVVKWGSSVRTTTSQTPTLTDSRLQPDTRTSTTVITI